MKLLKQFHSAHASHTPLKQGVNERTACSFRFRSGRVQLGVMSVAIQFISLTPGLSQVWNTASDGNRFNGFRIEM
jgi:hypothetical protein